MGRKVTNRYLVYWDMDDLEEFTGLQSVLKAIAVRKRTPNIYAVLDNGLMILLK